MDFFVQQLFLKSQKRLYLKYYDKNNNIIKHLNLKTAVQI